MSPEPGWWFKDSNPQRYVVRWPGRGVALEIGPRAWLALTQENEEQ